jgi:hypothetical protein
MNTATTFTQQQKVDFIFNFLFEDLGIEEEKFWNELTAQEVQRQKEILKEESSCDGEIFLTELGL